MNKIRTFILGLAVIATGMLALSPLVSSPVAAIDTSSAVKSGVDAAGGKAKKNNNLPGDIQRVVNVLLFVLGAVAVLMIIIGGIRYVLSNGEAAQVTAAKNTVLYSVIGLVVALLAYAIVNFVVEQIGK